jgi:CitMHS family citrate-Mg2+:H+ or citrate-Ca2+:H+ symporter
MHDAGLFEPIIGRVVALVGHDPLKVVIGTTAIAAVAHLDGAGASTFMVTVPAMMPLYARLGMDPLTLTCTTALAAGTMNILPWGGPASRVATVLQMDVGQVFAPLAAATAAGMIAVFAFAALIGYASDAGCRQQGRARPRHAGWRARSAGRMGVLVVQPGAHDRDPRRARGRSPAAACRLPDGVGRGAPRQLPGGA